MLRIIAMTNWANQDDNDGGNGNIYKAIISKSKSLLAVTM